MSSRRKWTENEKRFNKHIDKIHVMIVELLREGDPKFDTFFRRMCLIANNSHLTPEMYIFLIGRIMSIVLLDEFVVDPQTRKFIDKHITRIHRSGPYVGKNTVRNMTFNAFSHERGKFIKLVLRKCGIIVEKKTTSDALTRNIDTLHKKIIHAIECGGCQSSLEANINKLITLLDVKRGDCEYKTHYPEFSYGFRLLIELALSYDMLMTPSQLSEIESTIYHLSDLNVDKEFPFASSNIEIIYDFLCALNPY